jgi:hypothetical protein
MDADYGIYCHMIERPEAGFGLVIGFTGHLQNVTANNYDSLTELHTLKIIVATAQIKFSESSQAVAW